MAKRPHRRKPESGLEWKVEREEAGMTLHAFLRKHCPHAPSVKALKRAIDGKYCTVNGKVEMFSSHPLKVGNKVALDPRAFGAKAASMGMLVLYEDEELLICNKPAGVVSDNRILNQKLPSYHGRLQLVHRLDKETSGALILAKNSKIKEQMIALFAALQVRKVYVAIVDGEINTDSGKIDYPLKRTARSSGQAFVQVAEKGQPALTEWSCLARGTKGSLLMCEPKTGRTHQLRVHLNTIGHPILGDLHYGRRFRSAYRPERHLLHAYQIAFTHPVQNIKIEVTAPIPKDFIEACAELQIELHHLNLYFSTV